MSSTIKPVLGSQLQFGHPLATGLVGLWLFNEGSGNTKVFDLSGNQSQYYGDFINSPVWTAGKYGSAIYFRGNTTDDAIKLRIWPGYPVVTFFAIVRFDRAIGDVEQIIAADSSGDGHRTFQFRRSAAGKLNFIVFVGNAAKSQTGNTTLTTGVYYSVAGVNDGTNVHVYVNGILDDSGVVASGAMDNDASAWTIAGRPVNDDYTGIVEDMQGNIDCLYAYDSAPTAGEVAKLHREPFCILGRDPIELWSAATIGAAPVGAAGIMTTNAGFWGPTF